MVYVFAQTIVSLLVNKAGSSSDCLPPAATIHSHVSVPIRSTKNKSRETVGQVVPEGEMLLVVRDTDATDLYIAWLV